MVPQDDTVPTLHQSAAQERRRGLDVEHNMGEVFATRIWSLGLRVQTC